MKTKLTKEQELKEKCLEWQHGKSSSGYGTVRINGKTRAVHRVALEIKLGRKLKRAEMALHLCNNKSCYNQEHLKVGCAKENRRMAAESRKSFAETYLSGYDKIYGQTKYND
jgi:hypothetical protein